MLQARNLYKSFGNRTVVNDVTISVNAGEIVGILGPNGAGKTTCFYMIVGLLSPSNGNIYLKNKEITALPMYKRARLGIGYLPQESSIFRGMSVSQNLMAALEFRYSNHRQRQNALQELLAEFSIEHIKDSSALALSGGERRRVEIARALALQPDFILLDEPFAGIDPIAVQDIKNLVAHLKEKNIGVLITDHNVHETLGVIDRGYIIHSGQVIMEGDEQSIKNDEKVRQVYLGDSF